ncbi:hypothetical protein BDV98DRAFT_96992 [Pterulicium gracile]|uniref:Uncharacterized protein n=1 Tax=Pterulicium gracile TaxID=1884261 RepID=A0A5C3QHU3_9AGAR|nr:hypothetical protein BDV98DRAFT_96992 [Pterula gracilis]
MGWQLVWFIVNLESRGTSGLPLSLLEVSTFRHAISTIPICLICWRKPYGIYIPNLLPRDLSPDAQKRYSKNVP